MKQVLNSKDLAEYLGVSYSKIRKMISTQEESLPPAIKIGKCRRWRIETVDAWLAKNESIGK